MLWRREVLEQAGGIEALALDLAEDAAATKVVDAQGLRVRLVDAPFGQPLGHRRAADVWNRQVRWARLRRASFPACYFSPRCSPARRCRCSPAALLAASADVPVVGAIVVLAVVWYGAECALARAARWHLSRALAARLDAARPDVAGALDQWLARAGFVWRGNAMRAGDFSPFSSAR